MLSVDVGPSIVVCVHDGCIGLLGDGVQNANVPCACVCKAFVLYSDRETEKRKYRLQQKANGIVRACSGAGFLIERFSLAQIEKEAPYLIWFKFTSREDELRLSHTTPFHLQPEFILLLTRCFVLCLTRACFR